MKNKAIKSMLFIGSAVIILGSKMTFSEPGSESDPLVSLSYVNNKIEQIKEYIDVKLSSSQASEGTGLEIVELMEGECLVGKSGTEIILRGGKSTAYGVEVDKGLSDLTDGKDIDSKNNYLPANHLLLIPRDDGRGAYAVTDSIFLVRGRYEIIR